MSLIDRSTFYPELLPQPIPSWFFWRNHRYRWIQNEKTGDWKVIRLMFLKSGFRYVKKIETGRYAGQWKVRFRWWRQLTDGMVGRKPDYEFDRQFRHRMAAVWAANIAYQLLHPDCAEERGVPVDSRWLCDSIAIPDERNRMAYYLYVFGDERRPTIRVSEEHFFLMRFIPLFWRSERRNRNADQAVFFLVGDRKDKEGVPKLTMGWIPFQTLMVEDLIGIRPGTARIKGKIPVRKLGSDPRDYRPESFVTPSEVPQKSSTPQIRYNEGGIIHSFGPPK